MNKQSFYESYITDKAYLSKQFGKGELKLLNSLSTLLPSFLSGIESNPGVFLAIIVAVLSIFAVVMAQTDFTYGARTIGMLALLGIICYIIYAYPTVIELLNIDREFAGNLSIQFVSSLVFPLLMMTILGGGLLDILLLGGCMGLLGLLLQNAGLLVLPTINIPMAYQEALSQDFLIGFVIGSIMGAVAVIGIIRVQKHTDLAGPAFFLIGVIGSIAAAYLVTTPQIDSITGLGAAVAGASISSILLASHITSETLLYRAAVVLLYVMTALLLIYGLPHHEKMRLDLASQFAGAIISGILMEGSFL